MRHVFSLFFIAIFVHNTHFIIIIMELREGFFLFFFLFYSCFFYVGTASRQFLLSRTVIFSEILGIRKVSIFIFYIILFSFTFVFVSLGTRSNGDFWWDGILKIQRLVYLSFLSFFFFLTLFYLLYRCCFFRNGSRTISSFRNNDFR